MNPPTRSGFQRALLLALALVVIAVTMACKPPIERPLSSDKAITAFSFVAPPASGVIDETARAIAVTVPYGMNVTALVATFTTTGSTVTVGSTVQASGSSANDFSNPVVYTVTAEDRSTMNYTVTVTVALSSDKAITSFSFASPSATGVIEENTRTIAVTVPHGTDVTALVATFATTGSGVTVGSTVQASGSTANDFTQPVVYTVTAADNSTAAYTATVTVALSSEKAMTAFSFASPPANGVIDENVKTISVTVPHGTDGSALVAAFTTTGASVKVGSAIQVSGVTMNNFTDPVVYTVTAEDGTAADYAVTVSPPPSGVAQWAQTPTSGTYFSFFYSAAVDSGGNVYAAGFVYGSGTFSFGNGVSAAGTSASGRNVLLVKYDSSGTALWARSVSAGTAGSYFQSAVVDAGGNVYAAGQVTGTETYSFGDGVTAAGPYGGGANVVLVKYNSSGTALWARIVSTGAAASRFTSVAVDSGGNVYAAGDIYGTEIYTFGSGVTVAGACTWSGDVVLVKYDSSGTALWARSVSAASGASSRFDSLAADSFGNVYAAGNICTAATFDFGGGVTAAGTCVGSGNVVLVKYDSSGTALWARTDSGASTASASFCSTAVDSSGSAYAAGQISGTATYSFGGAVTATGANNEGTSLVLVKYDSTGTPLWARTVSGPYSSSFWSAAVDSGGNVYASGSVGKAGTYTFAIGVTAVVAASGSSAVLVKYGPSGTALWARTVSATSTADSSFWSVSVDTGGSLYAGGCIVGNSGTYTFGTGVTIRGAYAGGANAVLVRYSK